MIPMLAFKYSDYKARLNYPQFIQPKLNGVRCVYAQGVFQSRDELLWNESVLAHLQQELKQIVPDNLILDGELYKHGWSLQQINSAVAVKRQAPSDKTKEIEYHIFDCIDLNNPMLSFEGRNKILHLLEERMIFHRTKKLFRVQTDFAVSFSFPESLYTDYRRRGYEGIMYRSPSAPYGFSEQCTNKENRWSRILKRKEWCDDKFEIIGIKRTSGDKGFPGFKLYCKTKENKVFTVGSGLTFDEVEYFLSNPPDGKLAHVRYENLSLDGIPLQPRIETIEE